MKPRRTTRTMILAPVELLEGRVVPAVSTLHHAIAPHVAAVQHSHVVTPAHTTGNTHTRAHVTVTRPASTRLVSTPRVVTPTPTVSTPTPTPSPTPTPVAPAPTTPVLAAPQVASTILGPPPPASTTPSYQPNGTAMDKAGQTLNAIYQDYVKYENSGAQGPFVSSQSGAVKISGTSVGVDVVADTPSDVALVTAQLRSLGMTVTATDPGTGTIEGMLPIAQVPFVAGDINVVNLTPLFQPVAQGGVGGQSPRFS